MEFYIARRPVFSRRMAVFGYKLELCPNLVNAFAGMYREPEDGEALYRQLCFTGFDEARDKPALIIEYSPELYERLLPVLPKKHTIIAYGNTGEDEMTRLRQIRKIKTLGYRVLYEADEAPNSALLQLVDLVKSDFKFVSLEAQVERIRRGRGNALFCAGTIDTWEDFGKALVMGYDCFQGEFFLKRLAGKPSGLKSFNASILRVMGALSKPEPGFKEITTIIEHDLSLSYNLLRLAGSAYMAPKFKVKTISQAVTLLGSKELSAFLSTMMMKQMKSPENDELLRYSLIRGKLMDLLAGAHKVPQKGSEAFFVGMFSLIDVILNRPMKEILDELPLTDAVREALLGGDGELRVLLDKVLMYEEARWDEFDDAYSMDITEQEKMMHYYLSALKWAESFDI